MQESPQALPVRQVRQQARRVGVGWTRGGVAWGVLGPACTSMSVEAQLSNCRWRVFASALSTVKPYSRFTATTRAAYQHAFLDGSHSAASRPPLLAFVLAAARVRLSRSRAKALFWSRVQAQAPESWASESATMCSICVSSVLAKCLPVYGP